MVSVNNKWRNIYSKNTQESFCKKGESLCYLNQDHSPYSTPGSMRQTLHSRAPAARNMGSLRLSKTSVFPILHQLSQASAVKRWGLLLSPKSYLWNWSFYNRGITQREACHCPHPQLQSPGSEILPEGRSSHKGEAPISSHRNLLHLQHNLEKFNSRALSKTVENVVKGNWEEICVWWRKA